MNGSNGADGEDGEDGADGITPELRIKEETNEWEVSYDGGTTWASLGISATGQNGRGRDPFRRDDPLSVRFLNVNQTKASAQAEAFLDRQEGGGITDAPTKYNNIE